MKIEQKFPIVKHPDAMSFRQLARGEPATGTVYPTQNRQAPQERAFFLTNQWAPGKSKKEVVFLSLEEQQELGQRKDKGDIEARNKFVESHMHLVVGIAKSYARKNPARGAALEDIVHNGVIGLIEAVDKYDWSKGNKLTSLAKDLIKNKIREGLSLEYHVYVPLDTRKDIEKFHYIRRVLSKKQQEESPLVERVAKVMGVKPDRAKELYLLSKKQQSMDAPIKGEENGETTTLHDFTPSDTNHEEEIIKKDLQTQQRVVLRAELQKACAGNNNPGIEFIIRHFGLDGKEKLSDKQLANIYSMTPEQVRQRRRNILDKLSKSENIQSLRTGVPDSKGITTLNKTNAENQEPTQDSMPTIEEVHERTGPIKRIWRIKSEVLSAAGSNSSKKQEIKQLLLKGEGLTTQRVREIFYPELEKKIGQRRARILLTRGVNEIKEEGVAVQVRPIARTDERGQQPFEYIARIS